MAKVPQSSVHPHAKRSTQAILRADYPIAYVRQYQNGLELIRENTTGKGRGNLGQRGEIRGLSRQSLGRLAFMVFNSKVEFKSILTLTYGNSIPTTGSITKKHLKSFLQDMYRQFGKFSYVWWLEFQTRRHAPHYHLLLTLPEPSPIARKKMARLWVKAIYGAKKGYTDDQQRVFLVHSFTPKKNSKKRPAWEKIKKEHGARWYILKYATKHEQKEVPTGFSDVGRFWGASADVASKDYNESSITEKEVREFLENKGLSVAKAHILPKRIILLK